MALKTTTQKWIWMNNMKCLLSLFAQAFQSHCNLNMVIHSPLWIPVTSTNFRSQLFLSSYIRRLSLIYEATFKLTEKESTESNSLKQDNPSKKFISKQHILKVLFNRKVDLKHFHLALFKPKGTNWEWSEGEFFNGLRLNLSFLPRETSFSFILRQFHVKGLLKWWAAVFWQALVLQKLEISLEYSYIFTGTKECPI